VSAAWAAIAAATRTDHQRFLATLATPATVQAALLQRILTLQQASPYGQRYQFQRLTDTTRFRAALPLTDYEQLRPAIAAMLAGQGQALLADPVVLWEETGGSSGGSKAIPYTAAALDGFARAVRPWLHDLLHHRPAIGAGRAWFVISPALRPPRTAADGTPFGAEHDALYFGPDLLPLLAQVVLAPSGLTHLPTAAWRTATLHHLIADAGLSLLSVWSPTLLTGLLAAIPEEQERLLRLLRHGGHGLPPLPQRAAALSAALATDPLDTRRLWPQLQLVSCWTHATAARFLAPLRRLLPTVEIQGKGLLATEAAISLPLYPYPYPVLANESAFFEFLTPAGESRLAHELAADGEYEVVITTAGGLYRYRTGDQVAVRGFAERTPLLEFLGRCGRVGDLCGEKLTDAFVASTLPAEGFAQLAADPAGGGYLLLLDGAESTPAAATARAVAVEERLWGNPQYAHARRLGQLRALAARRLEAPLARYLAYCQRRGQRLGEIKPPALLLSRAEVVEMLSGPGPSTLPEGHG